MAESERSYEKITGVDLARLAKLATEDRQRFFVRNAQLARLYRRRILCTALCQGAALHYVNGKNGIKDFDVWTFFVEHPARGFPARRPVMNADFGFSRFGRNPLDEGFSGRRVDFLMRGIHCRLGSDPVEALRRYLGESRTKSASCLAKKAVVIIEPKRLRGSVVWPLNDP
jgi:hypothetical protein